LNFVTRFTTGAVSIDAGRNRANQLTVRPVADGGWRDILAVHREALLEIAKELAARAVGALLHRPAVPGHVALEVANHTARHVVRQVLAARDLLRGGLNRDVLGLRNVRILINSSRQ
jgi:hypothetical protein